MPGQARHFSFVTAAKIERAANDRVFVLPRRVTTISRSEPVLYKLKKIDGFIPAIFISLGFSNARLRGDSSAGVAGVASRPLEPRLLHQPRREVSLQLAHVGLARIHHVAGVVVVM